MNLNKYNLTAIIPGTLTDEQVKEIQEKIVAAVKNLNGEIKETAEAARKRLAFVIKKNRNGVYLDLVLELAEDAVKELEKSLKLIPEVLRAQIEKVAPDFTLAPKKPEYVFRPRNKEEQKEELLTAEPAMADKKISMEDLDKKLDEILGEEMSK
jgi:small subunit ribosomal protein S6